jgi:hypothetical protein
MHGLRVVRVARALGLGVLLAGCSSAAGRIENGVFHSTKGYQVKLPGDGWRLQPAGEADLSLERDAPPGGMLTNATCEGKPLKESVSLLTRHLTFGLKDRVIVEQNNQMLNGHPAAHTVLNGTLDGAKVAVEAVVLKTAHCVHDFLYVAPVNQFEDGRGEFKRFVESLGDRTP